jgi:hypothetical protein
MGPRTLDTNVEWARPELVFLPIDQGNAGRSVTP